MPRQVLHPRPQPREAAGRDRDRTIEADRRAGCAAACRSGSTNSKWFITFASRSICAGVEAERLPDFARRAPAAIGDDVGGHRRAERAVFLVDVLNDALAAIAARQIEIDVGPLAALLGQEALEQQLHADRIDGRDAEAVADGAVGRRAAALHEDVLLRGRS